ncbi:isoform Er10 of ankyrin-1 [Purpureocillium lavendulum]|uniref:Isoform Er10 of ankyrin-1 n=1 Tax=Purpureocillium lavendulum TaxID=1247861 RepID=A0AB34FRS0_9HYPO|nr:isoform Er10 of ankyrin-1 [Purpureocillium lavendulum]
MSLSSLDACLLEQVAGHLTDADLGALVRTSKQTHDALNQTLYKRTLLPRNEHVLPWAVQNSRIQTVHHAVSAGASVSFQGEHHSPLLIQAVIKGDTRLAATVLNARDADINVADLFGNTALSIACEFGDIRMVKMLVGHRGHWIHVNAPDARGRTPLMQAARCSNETIVHFLLAATPVRVERRCDHGHTALHYAAMAGDKEGLAPEQCVRHLLAAGVYPNKKGPLGRTALGYAAETGNFGIALRLMQTGVVDPNRPEGEYALTPKELAVRKGHAAVWWLLQNYPF